MSANYPPNPNYPPPPAGPMNNFMQNPFLDPNAPKDKVQSLGEAEEDKPYYGKGSANDGLSSPGSVVSAYQALSSGSL